MDKKVGVLVLSLAVIIISNLVIIAFSLSLFPSFSLTGESVNEGGVNFFISGAGIEITHPENETYNYPSMLDSYYAPLFDINLDLIIGFVPDRVYYILEQTTPRGNKNNFTSIDFTPNIIMDAYRWENDLTVYATSGELIFNDSVSFFINVNNTSPWIEGLNNSIYVCEGNAITKNFVGRDRDEDYLSARLNSPDHKELFFINRQGYVNDTDTLFVINSYSFSKDYLGVANVGSKNYSLEVSVLDPILHRDIFYSNVTFLEINNPPISENIGVKTVWVFGDDSVLEEQARFFDAESGDSNGGNLSFNISFFDSEPLFNIGSEGLMYLQANTSLLWENFSSRTYKIGVCATDGGLSNPHPMTYTLCGKTNESITTCQNFSLTITAENRPPTVTSKYPSQSIVSAKGLEEIYFNLTAYDPDGTIPDVYWYEGEDLIYSSSSANANFYYTYGCGVFGVRRIKAVITDGLLNDSVNWTINLNNTPCNANVPPSSGGGGGGTSMPQVSCTSNWVYGNWDVCQHLDKSLRAGFLMGEEYRVLSNRCALMAYDSSNCGFQIRSAYDLNNCSIPLPSPKTTQECFFVENPTCFDGLSNCHSGGCEVGVDCGGPCNACPTCSDKIQNQGEEGVDCGGPCPFPCEREVPMQKSTGNIYTIWAIIILVGIILLLIIILIVRFIKALKYKRIAEGTINGA